MIIHDAVYGDHDINDPVLLALINSEAMGRLRGVFQGGVTGLLGIAPTFSRFDHSLGVCILLRQLGAPLVEQIAGLLHDLSHTAFSHVTDFLFSHADQDYHEQLFAEFLARSDAAAVLRQHGHDWREFIDEVRFPLLEQPLPRLCADRLDYFFRDAVVLGLAQRDEIFRMLARLTVHAGRITVTAASSEDLGAARWLGETFMAADDACWSDLRELALYQLTANAIRAAMSAGCVDDADLMGTDAVLWQKLCECTEPAVVAAMAHISPVTRFVLDSHEPDFTLIPKIRAVDPDVWLEGRMAPLSRLDPDFSSRRRGYLARKDRPWPVRILPARDVGGDLPT